MAALQFLLMIPALGNFLFTFGTGVELIRFISFRAVFLQLPAGAAASSPPHGTGVNPGKNGRSRSRTSDLECGVGCFRDIWRVVGCFFWDGGG